MILDALPEKSPTVGLICPSAIFTVPVYRAGGRIASRVPRASLTDIVGIPSFLAPGCYNIDFAVKRRKHRVPACASSSKGFSDFLSHLSSPELIPLPHRCAAWQVASLDEPQSFARRASLAGREGNDA